MAHPSSSMEEHELVCWVAKLKVWKVKLSTQNGSALVSGYSNPLLDQN